MHKYCYLHIVSLVSREKHNTLYAAVLNSVNQVWSPHITIHTSYLLIIPLQESKLGLGWETSLDAILLLKTRLTHCPGTSSYISRNGGCITFLSKFLVLNYPHSVELLCLYPFCLMLPFRVSFQTKERVWLHLLHNPALGNWKQQFNSCSPYLAFYSSVWTHPDLSPCPYISFDTC